MGILVLNEVHCSKLKAIEHNPAVKFGWLLIFLPLLPCAQPVMVEWQSATVVQATSLPVTAPRLQLLPDGTFLVAWGLSGSEPQIWLSRGQENSFQAPVAVVNAGPPPALFGFGGFDLAVHDSLVFVVFERVSDGIWMSKSSDGGATFQAPLQVYDPPAIAYATLASIAVDPAGHPVISFIREQQGSAVYLVQRSSDWGESFDDPVLGNAPAPDGVVCECCVSDLWCSGDSVWLLFRNNRQNIRDIWVSRSVDNAATFSAAADVDATDWQVGFCPVSGPRFTRMHDSLAIVWMSQATGSTRVYLNTLHTTEMTAGLQRDFPLLPTVPNAQTFPDITAHGDTLGLVFVEKAREIAFYHSTNGAPGLSIAPQRISVPGHALQYPAIAFRNGTFHLVYVDATADLILYQQGRLSQLSATTAPKPAAFQLSPNPASSGMPVTLSTANETTGGWFIDLYTADGRWIQQWPLSANESSFELPLLPPGMYGVALRTNGRSLGARMLLVQE